MLINDLSDLIRIKHVSELPEWFDIKKYEAAKTLSAAGWYEQLFVRYYLYLALEMLQDSFTCEDEYDFDEETYIDTIDNTFLKIQENPIINVTTDQQLIEHFKQFIKMYRPNTSDFNQDDEHTKFLKKCYRKPDFNEWCRLSVLPYLDLQYWALEENVKIPNRVMADAIFPTGENGEETIRKTTEPLARRLITEISLKALLQQAALEIAERNNQ